jgi:small-conductance mechanosensitive channel
MITLDKSTKKQLIELFQSKNIGLEGNITKLIDSQGDEEFAAYLKQCTEKDVAARKKRLEMTKQVQTQNATLTKLNQDNERMMEELQNTLTSMEEQKSQIEAQNSELVDWKQENEKIGTELVEAMKQSEQARMIAENAKNEAENNLDMIQKKTQFELINNIVKVALYVIIGVGGITTGIYVYSMSIGMDTDIIGSTWSNMFGILLTNSFSIVGTILGVKYGTSPNKEEK